MTQISHIAEFDSVRCYRLSALVTIIGLVYINFFHNNNDSANDHEAPSGEEKKAKIKYTLTDFLYLYVLAEFLFFSFTIVTRIATILGIYVFKSGRLPGSPLNRKDEESGSALEIQGQL